MSGILLQASQVKELARARARESKPLNPREQKALEIDRRVDKVSQGVFQKIGDFFGSVVNGGNLKGKVLCAALLGAAAGVVAAFLFSNPIGWAVLGSVFVIAFCLTISCCKLH